MELSIFDEVGWALRGLAPPELGEHHHRAHRTVNDGVRMTAAIKASDGKRLMYRSGVASG